MATGLPVVVPSGALIYHSDGRLVTVPAGTVASPTDAEDKAGWVDVAGEVAEIASVSANQPILLALDAAPLVPASLTIASLDPLVLAEDGSGGFTGPTGSGTNAIDLVSGLGACSFNAPALGPVTAAYRQFGVATGTVFTLVASDGTPLGMGTITLSNGTPLQGSAQATGLPTIGQETVEFVVDPDPQAPTLFLTDENLDLETLLRIKADLLDCSELEQHEATIRGRNMPWVRRGVVLQVTDLHDENGTAFALPALLIQERTLSVAGGQHPSEVRMAKGMAWTLRGIVLPPGAIIGTTTGNASTFTSRGVWQPSTLYDLFETVIAAAYLTQVVFVAVRLGDVSQWSYPALSGPSSPFQAVISGLMLPAALEGAQIQDRDIFGWYGAHRIITLTGTVSGESLLIRDRGGAEHYVTYFPDVDGWTDTPTPPGM